jgi:hypothetical protein
MDNKEEIKTLLKGFDSLKTMDLTDNERIERFFTLFACLEKTLWLEYGQRKGEKHEFI